jgi:hypothetical protein
MRKLAPRQAAQASQPAQASEPVELLADTAPAA